MSNTIETMKFQENTVEQVDILGSLFTSPLSRSIHKKHTRQLRVRFSSLLFRCKIGYI